MNERPSWSSQFAFILAAIGSAVGLGNIWRFPYIMGQNGGAVFLVVYLLLIAFICIVPLLAELIFGKTTQKDVVGAFKDISPKLAGFGWLNIVTAVVICSFYFVVGGWIIYYIYNSFSLANVYDYGNYFNSLISGSLPLTLTLIFLIGCSFFVYRGVNKGIETANKIMMPIFATILIILTICSLNLPNAQLGLDFMFKPDFSKVNFQMLLAALGQALFTLSVGMGCILTYGSYLRKDESVVKSAYSIVIADTIFALLAGIMIFPAVFSFGLEPASGAGLVFITLPKIFAQMPFGGVVSMGFFFLLLFAAFTSGISMIEVPVSSFMAHYKLTRHQATLLVASIIGFCSIPAALSFGVLKGYTLLGKNIFDIFDFAASNIAMPINTLVVCLAVGWGLKLSNDCIFKKKFLHNIFMFMTRFVLPILLVTLLIAGLK